MEDLSYESLTKKGREEILEGDYVTLDRRDILMTKELILTFSGILMEREVFEDASDAETEESCKDS